MKKTFFLGLFFFVGSAFCNEADLIPLVVATREYPHIESIRNGSIQIPECRISYSTMSNTELNRHLDQGSAGDVIEVDFLSYLKRISHEEKHDWILVPVFLWREFPQRHVYVQSGERFAVDVANQSLLVWAKGILESSPTFKSIDAWNDPISTSSTRAALFPDFKTIEQEYFRETRIFPIITVLAVRRELVEANPWLPEAIFMAFAEAKSHSLESGTIPLPWGEEHREETITLMKKNYWSYGVKNNPKTLEAIFKYARECGAINSDMTAEDVFAEETLQLIDDKGAKN